MFVFTLVGNLKSLDEVKEALTKRLGNVVNEVVPVEAGYEVILQDNSAVLVDIPEHANTREKLMGQFNGMANFYGKIDTPHKEIQKGLLQQFGLWNAMVGIRFEEDDNDERTNYIYSQIIHTANDLNAFLIMANLDILNGKHELVFSAEGESKLTEFLPSMPADMLYPNRGEQSEEDAKRAKETLEVVKNKNLPFVENMTMSLRSDEVKLRTTEEIASRAIALFAVGLYSEAILHDEEHSVQKAFNYFQNVNEVYNIIPHLTKNELEYINSESYNEHNSIQMIWRYECSALLFWALGYIKELNDVTKICDVGALARLTKEFANLEEIAEKAELRDVSEMLFQQDLMMRYHWAYYEGKIKNIDIGNNFDFGVVKERHYALNWLLTDIFGNDFDKIDTPA